MTDNNTANKTHHFYMKDSDIGYQMEESLKLANLGGPDRGTRCGMACGVLEYIGIEDGRDFRFTITHNDDGSASLKLGKFDLHLSAEDMAGAAQHYKDRSEYRSAKFNRWLEKQKALSKASKKKKR